MASQIKQIKKDLIGEILSKSELEKYMDVCQKFSLIEESEDTDIIKFTNQKSQIWISVEADNNDFLITDIKRITRSEGELTRVKEFQSYEDLIAVLDTFKSRKQYDFWLIGWLCTSLGRRIGDAILLKWSDLFLQNGIYRERLSTLKEEKTGKVVGAKINALAQEAINEYIRINNISIADVYRSRIFIDNGTEWKKAKKNKYERFRIALAEVVAELRLSYPVGTHSFRKWYGNTLYKLHPQDSNNLEVIRQILGHSDIDTTRLYIGEYDKLIDQYNADYVTYMIAKSNGIDMDISNSPIVSIKAEDFRELLSKCWNMAQSGLDKFECVNELLRIVEQQAV